MICPARGCQKLNSKIFILQYTLYLVEGLDQISQRNQILARYRGFFRKLLTSPNKEVRVLARMVASDKRSITCRNLIYLREVSRDNIEWFASWKVRDSHCRTHAY